MLLRFRRHLFARLILLAFGFLSFERNLVFGQQDEKLEVRPNGLRLGDGRGSLKPTPLENRSQTLGTAPEMESILLIGSADTILASSIDSDEPLFAIENTEEIERVSSLALKIATASMSHVSPFFWWMAGPTSYFLENESVEVDQLDAKEVSIENSTKIVMSEPPRLMPREEVSSEILTAPENEATDAAGVSGKVDLEAAPRKPIPRTVRMPFDDAPDVAKPVAQNSEAPKQTRSRDPDSQRDQEEPQLDPRSGGNDREQQGVDALAASKPGMHRREIRIDDPSNEGIVVAPVPQGKPLEPVLAKRLQRTEACLAYYLDNPESTSVRSPWAVMHALLAFGSDYDMIHGQGRVNAIGWMCHNGTCRTQRIFTPNAVGFTPNVGGGVQGHEGQFLAILAQSNVPLNYPIQVGSSKFTVEDLVRYEMATCKEKSELTFKLIGLSYYLDSNKQWKAKDGKMWTISKLIQEEMAQPIIGAACGGVHRLMGFSFSVRQRQLQGQPINGQYARAAKFVRDYVEYTWQLQNPDGSFSTSWYEGRANEPNEERKVQTSGHMLEWLMYTLSDEEIKNPRVGLAIDFLLSKIYDKRENKWPIGPRGHATRAVALYQARTKEILSKPNASVPINSATKPRQSPIRK